MDRQAALWSAAAGAPACVLAAFVASSLEVTLLRRLFGVFLLAVGLRELFSKAENPPAGGAHKSPQGAHTSHETQTGPGAGNSTQKG